MALPLTVLLRSVLGRSFDTQNASPLREMASWSISSARPPLAVVDEELVPEAFWKPQPPKLDRQGLIAALAAGRDVPGAILGNAPMTISVRTK